MISMERDWLALLWEKGLNYEFLCIGVNGIIFRNEIKRLAWKMLLNKYGQCFRN